MTYRSIQNKPTNHNILSTEFGLQVGKQHDLSSLIHDPSDSSFPRSLNSEPGNNLTDLQIECVKEDVPHSGQ